MKLTQRLQFVVDLVFNLLTTAVEKVSTVRASRGPSAVAEFLAVRQGLTLVGLGLGLLRLGGGWGLGLGQGQILQW